MFQDSINIEPVATEVQPVSATSQHVQEEHLTFEEPDSILGAYFVASPSPLNSNVHHPDLHIGEFPLPKDSVFLSHLRQLWPEQLREITWNHEEIPWTPTGIAGDPVDYSFRNDNYVTSVILIGFFLMAWVIASSWRFLRDQLKDFFYTRERPSIFTEREDTVLRGRFFLVLQTCFMIAILFFAFSRVYLPEVFGQVSPYLLLGVATLLSAIYFGVKIMVYSIVNHTFFSPVKCKLWENSFMISILATGCALLPVTLLVVFFDLPFWQTALLCVLLLSVIKTLLLYKCYCIFFKSLLGGLHIILYFCALEIIPIGILGVVLIAVSNMLVTL